MRAGTSDAEFTVNASLYPVKSGSVYTQYATNTFDALPEQLRRAGYDTAAMHAFDKEFWNRANFYKQIGYNHFFHQDDDPLLEDYYHTVHYSDAAIGLMVEQLKADEKWDNTLVVFYGDHDSGLTVADGEMAVKADADSTVDLFQLDRGVPLFIIPAGLERGQTVQASGGQIDLAPTILDLLGMTPTYMLGRSLLDDEPNLTVFRNGSFRYDDLYFVPDLTKPVGSGTCYSVETGDDLPFQACEPYIDEATEQLRLSDAIIEKDALSDFTPNDKQAAPK